MTFQRFLAFLMFPISVIACAVLTVVTSVLYIPYFLVEFADWALFKSFEVDTHLQGLINWFYDAIGFCYLIAGVMIFSVKEAFDNDLF